MGSYRISEAATLLGVSDDTVRRWLDQGALTATGSPASIDGEHLARLAVERAQRGEKQARRAETDDGSTTTSARNRFRGLVTAVRRDTVMAQVDIQAGPYRVVSLMSSEAVDELGLRVGDVAVAVVKATTVIVETERR